MCHSTQRRKEKRKERKVFDIDYQYFALFATILCELCVKQKALLRQVRLYTFYSLLFEIYNVVHHFSIRIDSGNKHYLVVCIFTV